MKFFKFGLLTLMLSFFMAACVRNGKNNTSNSGNKPQSMLQKSEVSEKGPVNKGIGPIKEVTFEEEIDMDLATKGEEAYKRKGCVACHKPGEEMIGPAPKGVFERRTPEWVMNLILNSEEMREKDPDAKKLVEEYDGLPMSYQYVTQEEARAILEYFRTL